MYKMQNKHTSPGHCAGGCSDSNLQNPSVSKDKRECCDVWRNNTLILTHTQAAAVTGPTTAANRLRLAPSAPVTSPELATERYREQPSTEHSGSFSLKS